MCGCFQNELCVLCLPLRAVTWSWRSTDLSSANKYDLTRRGPRPCLWLVPRCFVLTPGETTASCGEGWEPWVGAQRQGVGPFLLLQAPGPSWMCQVGPKRSLQALLIFLQFLQLSDSFVSIKREQSEHCGMNPSLVKADEPEVSVTPFPASKCFCKVCLCPCHGCCERG